MKLAQEVGKMKFLPAHVRGNSYEVEPPRELGYVVEPHGSFDGEPHGSC